MIDYDKVISGVIKDIKPSGIRKFFDIAATMEGVISLGVGEPDFPTPWTVRKAAITALERGKTVYTANAGLEQLRKVITDNVFKKVGIQYNHKDEIIVTVGGSEAIDLGIRTLVTPGDEVIIVNGIFSFLK